MLMSKNCGQIIMLLYTSLHEQLTARRRQQCLDTGKTLCKYRPVFAPYLHDWTLYGINTVQKRVRIYMAFFL